MSVTRKAIREAKIEFWNHHQKNVLFVGRSGCGKTAIVREGLEKSGLKFGESVAYYSIHDGDFVGDPTTAKVVVFDTLNDPQAQKAAHEVCGLRVWKGKPVTAHVWGAFTIDDEIEVPKPVLTSFDIAVEVPYCINEDYFTAQFGATVTANAVEWWSDLDEETQNFVSPRILESGLQMWKVKGDMRDCLPPSCNVSKLSQMLNGSPTVEMLQALVAKEDAERVKELLANENTFVSVEKFLLTPAKQPKLTAFVLPLLSEHRLTTLMEKNDEWFQLAAQNRELPNVNVAFRAILTDNQRKLLCKKIRRVLTDG